MKRAGAQDVSTMASLGRLFAEHQSQLLIMIRRRMPTALESRVNADDVLAEGFLRAQKRWPKFQKDQPTSGYAWLYRICLDQLIDTWRRECRQIRDVRRELPWPERSSVELGLQLFQSKASPSRELARDELREQVRKVMSLLADRDQEILAMRHFDGLTFSEASAVLGISESAANMRYVRALRRLRALWEELGLET